LIQLLSALCTCRDGKGGELSNQASEMLYSPPGAVNVASYKESLDHSAGNSMFSSEVIHKKVISKGFVMHKQIKQNHKSKRRFDNNVQRRTENTLNKL